AQLGFSAIIILRSPLVIAETVSDIASLPDSAWWVSVYANVLFPQPAVSQHSGNPPPPIFSRSGFTNRLTPAYAASTIASPQRTPPSVARASRPCRLRSHNIAFSWFGTGRVDDAVQDEETEHGRGDQRHEAAPQNSHVEARHEKGQRRYAYRQIDVAHEI